MKKPPATVTAFLTATVVILCACGAAARADEYLDVAKEIGDYLISSARHDGDGLYWQQYEGGPANTGEENKQLPVSLYNGLAGIGFFFVNLHAVTGDAKYLNAAKGVGVRLVALAERAPSGGLKWNGKSERKGHIIPDGDGLGLYTGSAGIGVFLIHLYRVSGDEKFRKCAEAAFERILKEAKQEKEGSCWEYAMQDVIGGEAGIGLGLLEMCRLTKNSAYSDAAQKAGHWLLSKATAEGEKCRWTTYGCLDPNFSHGTAGIAFFLAALKEPGMQKAGIGAAAWIESAAEPSGNGIFWKQYVGKPPEGKENSTMHSWCHGSPGTVNLFILLHRATGKEHFLDVARKAGEGLRNELRIESGKPIFANPTFCCGGAGCVDAFCNIYQASKDKKFLDDARSLADAIIKDLRKEGNNRLYALYDEEDEAAKKFPYFPTGFMVGNAGVGYSLLRLSAIASGKADKLVLLPDQPFAIDVKK